VVRELPSTALALSGEQVLARLARSAA